MTKHARIAAWLEGPNGECFQLTGSNSIGRSSKNDIVVDCSRVSRRHALIQAQDADEYWLVDLGSSNGIRLNDRRVVQPTPLQISDVIDIAGHIYRFQRTAQSQTVALDPYKTQATTTSRELRNTFCWLLVTDIQGFTKLSQTLSADDLAQLVGGWLGSCTTIIRERRGSINKYLGDGLLAYWPDGEENTRAVFDAVNQLRVLQAGSNPAFRIILHHGSITIGGLSAGGEESLLGKEVNFVFRLEKVAAEMKLNCLFSEAAVGRRTGGENLTELPSRPVPGFEGTFRFFTI
jgi:adenylate cyclase